MATPIDVEYLFLYIISQVLGSETIFWYNNLKLLDISLHYTHLKL